MGNTEEKQKKRILQGTVIHELKTHLSVIITATDLLTERLQPKPGDIVDKLLRSIDRNAQSMNQKTSRLSDLYGSTDFSEPPRETIAIASIISEVSSHLAPVIRGRRQTLNREIPDDLLPVSANRQYVGYVFLTLVHNASKFSLPGDHINVTAHNENDSVVVCVEDHGIGIPKEEWENIVQPRHRLIDSHTGNAGSGVGLAMAKFLVELHDGKLWLDSEVGKGSRFFVSFPSASQ